MFPGTETLQKMLKKIEKNYSSTSLLFPKGKGNKSTRYIGHQLPVVLGDFRYVPSFESDLGTLLQKAEAKIIF